MKQSSQSITLKYLGILIDNCLKFDKHVSYARGRYMCDLMLWGAYESASAKNVNCRYIIA